MKQLRLLFFFFFPIAFLSSRSGRGIWRKSFDFSGPPVDAYGRVICNGWMMLQQNDEWTPDDMQRYVYGEILRTNPGYM